MKGRKNGVQIYEDNLFYEKRFHLGRHKERAEWSADKLTTVTSKEVAALFLCNNNILITALYGLLAMRVVCQRLCKQTQIENLVCIRNCFPLSNLARTQYQ